MDQHLFAEWREIKMIPKSLARSLAARGTPGVLARVPANFTLGEGHVSFFYDKGLYLAKRYGQLTRELERREVNFNKLSWLDPDGVYAKAGSAFIGDYEPTPAALEIIRSRIAMRIYERPNWYRYEGALV